MSLVPNFHVAGFHQVPPRPRSMRWGPTALLAAVAFAGGAGLGISILSRQADVAPVHSIAAEDSRLLDVPSTEAEAVRPAVIP